MKKTIFNCLIASVFSVCFCFAVCNAANETLHLTEWVAETPGAVYNSEADSLSLSFEAESSEEGNEYATHNIICNSDVLVLEFKASYEDSYPNGSVNDGSHTKSVFLRSTENSDVMLEMMCFDNSQLKVFGQSLSEFECANSESYNVMIAIDMINKAAAVWLNSEIIYNGDITSLWNDELKSDSLELFVWNSFYQRRKSASSSFTIANFYSGTASESTAATTPGNNEITYGGRDSVITLDWGGFTGPAKDDEGNFIAKDNVGCYTLTEDGDTIDFSVNASGSVIEIIPENQLGYDKTYRLTSTAFRDVFNTKDIEGIDLTFKTAIENYKAPVVELQAYDDGNLIAGTNTEIFTGDEILFKCRVESDVVIEKVVFSSDENIAEITEVEDGAYSYIFKSLNAGSYEVSVKAVDAYGGVSEEKYFIVNVKENTPPSVSFKFPEDNAQITAAELTGVEVEANDAEGSVKKVELFVDRELFCTLSEKPFKADLSSLEKTSHIISAVAYDERGLAAECRVNIIVIGDTFNKVLWEESFDRYKGGKTDEMTGVVGSIEGKPILRASTEYGEENGIVCEWYADRTQSDDEIPDTWVGYDLPYGNVPVTYEFDLNVKSFPEYIKIYLLQQYYEGSSKKTLNLADVLLAKDKLTIYNTSFPIELEENHWYRIIYTINFSGSSISAVIYDYESQGNILETPFITMKNTVVEDLKVNLRMSTAFIENGVTCFAMDNMVVKKSMVQPTIKSIGYDTVENPEVIPPEKENVTVFMSQPINSENISDDTVKVYDGDREVLVENVTYGDNIKITFKEKLKSNTAYTVKIQSQWYDDNGEEITEELSKAFLTDYYDIDSKNVELVKNGEKYAICGTLVDKKNKGGYIFAILTLREAEKIVSVSVEKLSLINDADFETESFSKNQSQTVDIALWKSLTQPEMVSYSVWQ